MGKKKQTKTHLSYMKICVRHDLILNRLSLFEVWLDQRSGFRLGLGVFWGCFVCFVLLLGMLRKKSEEWLGLRFGFQ